MQNLRCANCSGFLRSRVQLLDSMPARGLQPDTTSYNATLAALHTAGEEDETSEDQERVSPAQRLQRVLALLKQMHGNGPQPDSISYGTAIYACAKAKDLRTAESLLAEMRDSGTRLDAACYNAVLRTCEAVGDWERALEYEVEMGNADVAPEIASYTILMQCLAASSRLREGFALLDRLPTGMVPLSFPLHHALREACRSAGEEGMLGDVSERIDSHGLTNISPEAVILVPDGRGNTESVTHITGTHTPELASIINDLVSDCVRHTSYRVQMGAVPLDRVNESREKQAMALRNHPEKKALADLLQRDNHGMRIGHLSRGDRVCGDLEIAINFKACVDCHAFFKGCSQLLRRRVVLHENRRRDTNKASKTASLASTAHVFENGHCSCGAMEDAENKCAATPTEEALLGGQDQPKARKRERDPVAGAAPLRDRPPRTDHAGPSDLQAIATAKDGGGSTLQAEYDEYMALLAKPTRSRLEGTSASNPGQRSSGVPPAPPKHAEARAHSPPLPSSADCTKPPPPKHDAAPALVRPHPPSPGEPCRREPPRFEPPNREMPARDPPRRTEQPRIDYEREISSRGCSGGAPPHAEPRTRWGNPREVPGEGRDAYHHHRDHHHQDERMLRGRDARGWRGDGSDRWLDCDRRDEQPRQLERWKGYRVSNLSVDRDSRPPFNARLAPSRRQDEVGSERATAKRPEEKRPPHGRPDEHASPRRGSYDRDAHDGPDQQQSSSHALSMSPQEEVVSAPDAAPLEDGMVSTVTADVVAPLEVQVREAITSFALGNGRLVSIFLAHSLPWDDSLAKRLVDTACKTIGQSLQSRGETSYAIELPDGTARATRVASVQRYLEKLVAKRAEKARTLGGPGDTPWNGVLAVQD